jgi:hypothetical protein
MYVDISKRSYDDSQSSQQLSCREFADQFFIQFIENPSDKLLHIPIETRRKWSNDFKSENDKFIINEQKMIEESMTSASPKKGKRSKKRLFEQTVEKESTDKDWSGFVMNRWMKSKKSPFFKEFVTKKGLLQFVKPEYKLWFNNWRKENKNTNLVEDECFGEYLCKEMVENTTSVMFSNMNIVRMMSLYLCGLTCSSQEYEGELMDLIRTLVKTNGIYQREENYGNFTTTLKCPWINATNSAKLKKKDANDEDPDTNDDLETHSEKISFDENYKVRKQS